MIKNLAFVISLLLLGTTTDAVASGPEPSFWVGANTGVGTYEMSSFNDEIEKTNHVMEMGLDEVGGGFAYGVQGGVRLYGRVGLLAGYERLFGATSSEANGYELDYEIPASAFFFGVEYSHPWSPRFHPGIGFAVGRISADGRLETTTIWEGSLTKGYDGESTIWQGALTGDLLLSKRLVFSPSIGYRKALIHDLRVAGEIIYLDDGRELELDYSGILGRIGMKFYLN